MPQVVKTESITVCVILSEAKNLRKNWSLYHVLCVYIGKLE